MRTKRELKVIQVEPGQAVPVSAGSVILDYKLAVSGDGKVVGIFVVDTRPPKEKVNAAD